MTIFRDLAVSVGELTTKFVADLVTASGGAMSASGNVATIDNKVFVRVTCTSTSTYEEDGETKTMMEDPCIELGGLDGEDAIVYTRALGSNNNAHSLAYEIISMASGDVLVKFAQWTSLEPLDIMAESFQAWGIAAYSADESVVGNFLSGERLMSNDLLAGMNFGGFLLHKMKDSDTYGITVFEKSSMAPIFTWLPDGPISYDGTISYVATSGAANYIEKKRRFYGSNSSQGIYKLFIQEPYQHPKTGAAVLYAVLAPIFSPSTNGDYSKTARRLIQSPHMYNPFDSDGFLLIDGGEKGAFYCDHGICLSAKGEEITDTGNQRPSPNPWLEYRLGYYPHTSSPDTYGVYGVKTIEY